MTRRQIRIACCGMVVSTRPFPNDPADLYAVAEDVLKDVDVLLDHARAVDVWAVEGNLIWGMTRYA